MLKRSGSLLAISAAVAIAAGAQTNPVLPASVCTSIAGENVNCPATLGARAVNASVNGVFNVAAFGAVGNCTSNRYLSGQPVESDGRTLCTDNHNAIQAAINAAYAVGGAVYFPTTSQSGQTVYYTTTISPKGVSMYGPPGAQGSENDSMTSSKVALRGAPGMDLFDSPDPKTSGYVKPLHPFTVRDLSFILDDSVDASSTGTQPNPAFVNRFPGRTCWDVSTTAGSAVIKSSAQCEFEPGDAGQPISLAGAAGGAPLVTTIGSYTSPTSVTLAESASQSMSNAKTYISLDNLPVNQTVGNCIFAWDDSTGSIPWIEINDSLFENIRATAISNNGLRNHSCGFFAQGNYSVQASRWQNANVQAQFPFVFAPINAAPPKHSIWTGMGDLNVFDHLYIEGTYGFIAYDGNDNTIRDVQEEESPYGVAILSAYGLETIAQNWHVDIPEMEITSSDCAAFPAPTKIYSLRLTGYSHVFDKFAATTCPNNPSNFQWDANRSTVAALQLGVSENINISGNQNAFKILFQNGSVTSYNITGFGNTWLTTSLSNPLQTYPVARSQYAGGNTNQVPGPPQLSRGAVALNRTHDFIDKGASAYYYNSEDLWIWPGELTGFGSVFSTVADRTSETGTAWQLTGTKGYIAGGLDGTRMFWGEQFPAGKVRFYVKAKANTSIAGWTAEIVQHQSSWVNVCVMKMNLTADYQVGYCDGDATGQIGAPAYVYFSGSGSSSNTVSVAWVALRPWDTSTLSTSLQFPSGAPMTGSAGNGGYIQETTSAAKTSGHLVSFDANGNSVDSGTAPSVIAMLSSSSGTSAAHSFRTGFLGTPNCTVTPTTNAGNFYISALSSSQIAVAYANSGAQRFNVQCIGADGAW
ncbi:MAG: hypothetical protein WBW68_09565 [Terracidiphilus sp.]